MPAAGREGDVVRVGLQGARGVVAGAAPSVGPAGRNEHPEHSASTTHAATRGASDQNMSRPSCSQSGLGRSGRRARSPRFDPRFLAGLAAGLVTGHGTQYPRSEPAGRFWDNLAHACKPAAAEHPTANLALELVRVTEAGAGTAGRLGGPRR